MNQCSRLLAGGMSLVRGAVRFVQFWKAVVVRFYSDHCLQQASALAYATLLSLVPLLAVMFAVLKGLGVQRRLEPLLLSRLGLDPSTTHEIITFIDRTNVGTLGTLGAAVLVLTVISVLGSVESSFNCIWRVRRDRSIWQKATDYVGAVLLVPFLLLGAVAVTSSSQSHAVLQYLLRVDYVGDLLTLSTQLVPVVINALAIGVMYALMPNRRPHVGSILIAAIVAGILWQVVQIGYVSLQIGVARYNAIYGALSQLPVTLVWIYVSWTVVLAGAEVAAVCEFGVDVAGDSPVPVSRWAVAVQLLMRAAETFRGDGGAVDPRQVARELRVDDATVREIAELLENAGILAEVEGRSYLLARDPAVIGLATVDAVVESTRVPTGCAPELKDALDRLAKERLGGWREKSLADLLSVLRSADS